MTFGQCLDVQQKDENIFFCFFHENPLSPEELKILVFFKHFADAFWNLVPDLAILSKMCPNLRPPREVVKFCAFPSDAKSPSNGAFYAKLVHISHKIDKMRLLLAPESNGDPKGRHFAYL